MLSLPLTFAATTPQAIVAAGCRQKQPVLVVGSAGCAVGGAAAGLVMLLVRGFRTRAKE